MKNKNVLFSLLAILLIVGIMVVAQPVHAQDGIADAEQTTDGKEFTSEVLIGLSGVAISLLFSYAPGFADWYNRLEAGNKSLVMLGIMILVTIGTYLLGRYEIVGSIQAGKEGIIRFAMIFATGMITNQTTHTASPKVGLKVSAKDLPDVK